MKKIFILFALCIATVAARGQNMTFNHLTTEDGLSQFSVNSLYVDEQGIIWIGTRAGLNRYNGNDITRFGLNKHDTNSLFSNTVLRITGNGRGFVYLHCIDGVAELNLQTLRFKTLLQGDVNAIFFHEKLYIGRKNRIYVYNEATSDFDFFYELKEKAAAFSCFHIDGKKNLWMGTTENGVYKLDGNGRLSHPVSKGNITSIYEDSDGELWIGSWEEGLYRVKTDGGMQNFRHNLREANSLSSDFVRSCCEDNNGNLWIGTFNGLNRYEKTTGKFTLYTSENNRPGSLTHSSVWCIVKDGQGTLWLGTYFGGVNFFNPEYEIYTRYKVGTAPHEGLSSPIIGRMTEDKHDNLWICTEGGGVNVYDRKRNNYRWYRHREGENSLSHDNVKAICYDGDNDLMWIGTHLGGLNRLDLRTGRFTVYRSRPGDDSSIPSDIVRDIIPYGRKLIVGTQAGVCLFDPATGLAEPLFKNRREGQDIQMVAGLCLDDKGTLWMAVTGKGVYAYHFESRKLVNYAHDPKNPHSISNNTINNIAQDSRGNLWFSTSGSGLDRYRPETDDFENFDVHSNGLANDCVYNVCESSVKKGHLLLITNQGFSQFDVESKTFSNYGIENGFPLTAVNENAIYVTRDGTVFLGGVQGMISFSEKSLRFTPKPYHITFSRLLVNGKEVLPDDDGGILRRAIGHTDELRLKSHQSMFSIEFATSNFIPANRDEIIYKLEGFSETWNKAYHNNITYTNLNPGRYTLVVRSKQNDVGEAKIAIVILPPWYKSWWAYLIYLTVIGSLSVYLVRSYKSRIKLRESLRYEQKHTADVEALNQSKLRFFTNISHELRTPLTLIVAQSERLLQASNFTPAVYNKILGIYKNGVQLRELITELLDFQKHEQGHMKIRVARQNIVNFLYENHLLFLEYAKNKALNFSFRKSHDEIELWYDPKQMQKVVNNLLSNAMKHTKPGDAIEIGVVREDGEVVISVTDTGSGIEAKDLDKIFDRFYQTDRPDPMNTGTGIGLALTKGIVELHHGTIGVESIPGKGSTFIIRLKTGNAHFTEEEIVLDSPDVSRPGQTSLLIETLPASEPEAEEEEESRPPADATILIAEDNESIKQTLIEIFAGFYRVVSASDGEEAWEIICREMPTIVLSDVVMPRLSGTELCKRIKSNIETCHIPVVLLTARTAVEHNIEGLLTGANDYVTKPFNTNLLVARCNNLVNSHRLLQEKFSKQPQAFAQMLATNPMDKELLDRAIKIIEENMDNTNFNINTFAREMGMARTNLFNKLKAVTGQTPNDFVLNIRLKRGAFMLRNNPEMNVAEIADRIGFSSARYFSKCFKEMYNQSPMTYRKDDLRQGANKKNRSDSED